MSDPTNPIIPGFENLTAALEAAKRPFFSTGTLPLDAHSKGVAILVAEASEGKPSRFDAVYFPLENEGQIQPILEASRQASSGRGEQDILDPSYRHALVLDKDQFAIYPTNRLDPHGLGILASVAETLFPSSLLSLARDEVLKGGTPEDSGKKGIGMKVDPSELDDEPSNNRRTRIIAQLDKLNVYAQGHLFKNIDTPRSPDMVGTLLINLPVRHQGGQLVVRAPTTENRSTRMERDEYTTNWGDGPNIEWIAFSSDCEHEVLPVTSGHR